MAAKKKATAKKPTRTGAETQSWTDGSSRKPQVVTANTGNPWIRESAMTYAAAKLPRVSAAYPAGGKQNPWVSAGGASARFGQLRDASGSIVGTTGKITKTRGPKSAKSEMKGASPAGRAGIKRAVSEGAYSMQQVTFPGTGSRAGDIAAGKALQNQLLSAALSSKPAKKNKGRRGVR